MEEKGKNQGRGGWKKDVLGLVVLEQSHSMRTRQVYGSFSLIICLQPFIHWMLRGTGHNTKNNMLKNYHFS